MLRRTVYLRELLSPSTHSRSRRGVSVVGYSYSVQTRWEHAENSDGLKVAKILERAAASAPTRWEEVAVSTVSHGASMQNRTGRRWRRRSVNIRVARFEERIHDGALRIYHDSSIAATANSSLFPSHRSSKSKAGGRTIFATRSRVRVRINTKTTARVGARGVCLKKTGIHLLHASRHHSARLHGGASALGPRRGFDRDSSVRSGCHAASSFPAQHLRPKTRRCRCTGSCACPEMQGCLRCRHSRVSSCGPAKRRSETRSPARVASKSPAAPQPDSAATRLAH